MAISTTMLLWLLELRQRGILRDGFSLIELGPQDVTTSEAALRHFARCTGAGVEAFLQRMREERTAEAAAAGDRIAACYGGDASRLIYERLGTSAYTALDLYDPRATVKHDLNLPLTHPSRYDVVMNGGTAEHIFNIGEAFRTIHSLLGPGGVALGVLPTEGDYNHGFYNIHSTLYRNLALANGYDVVDLYYYRNFGELSRYYDAHPTAAMRRVDIRTRDVYEARLSHLRYTFILTFERLKASLTRRAQPYNYIFSALRKRTDAPFVFPSQSETYHA